MKRLLITLTAALSLITSAYSNSVLRSGSMVADSKAHFEAANQIIESGDVEALVEMQSQGKIALTDHDVDISTLNPHWDGCVEIRIRGSSKVFWTSSRSLVIDGKTYDQRMKE
jgi:hypothetical protein